MSKKIKPNLASMLSPNRDGNAMLKALQGSHSLPAPPSSPLAEEEAPAPVSNIELTEFDPTKMNVTQLVVGNVYNLPLSMLTRSDFNARVYYNPSEVEEMAESLALTGQDVPAVGYVKGNTVVIVDGQKRFNACTQAKLANLFVQIKQAPATEAEEYETSRRINVGRSTQTAFDDAVRWEQLLKKEAYRTQEELAERLNVSKSTVSKTLGLNRIPHSLRRMMAESAQTATLAVAYEISNIFSNVTEENAERLEAIAEEVIGLVIKKELGRAQTIELVRVKQQGPKSRLRGETQSIRFGQFKGSIKVVPSRGDFSLSFKGLAPEALEELQKKLQVLLESE